MRVRYGIVLALSGFTAPLAGQIRLETGGGQSRLDQLASSSLTSFGGDAQLRLGATRVLLSSSAEEHFGLGTTSFAGGQWFYHFSAPGWQVDAGPEGQIAHDISAPWARTLSGHVVAERALGPVALRAEWQQGLLQAGSPARAWHRPTLTAEFRSGALQFGTTWQNTSIADTSDTGAPPAADSGSPRHAGHDIEDISAHMSWQLGALSAGGRAGRRFGLSIQPETWWEAQAALRLNPIMSFTARTGRLASDVLLGLRGGQFTTVGLRVDLLHPASNDAGAASGVDAIRVGADRLELSLPLAAGAHSASITGDLTGWQPVPLSRGDDGRWEAQLRATPGVYRINVRVDSGPWQAPAGLPTTDDGFGHKVGLLVVR